MARRRRCGCSVYERASNDIMMRTCVFVIVQLTQTDLHAVLTSHPGMFFNELEEGSYLARPAVCKEVAYSGLVYTIICFDTANQ